MVTVNLPTMWFVIGIWYSNNNNYNINLMKLIQ